MSCTFEVLGIDSHNKGALLMLEACCRMVRGWRADARMAITYRFDPAMRLKHGLWASLPREKLPPGLAATWERLPDAACRIGTLVRRSEIDVILDGSGFAYGDAWPTRKLKHRLAKTIIERPKGSKVILLPQAFGPFSDPEARSLLREALPQADLVFARDEESYNHICDVTGGAGENLRRAPDFSNLLETTQIADQSLAGGYWIVPNTKVLEKDGRGAQPRYLDFLARTVELMRARGLTPRVLIHEGPKDEAVARRLNERLAEPLELHWPDGALAAKAILGSAAGVISSRYHALVSALASAVPALACGWSHKYDALMQDYALDECVIDLGKPEDWDAKVDRLINLSQDPQARESLAAASSREKQKSREMWEAVFTCIEEGNRWRTRQASV